MSQAQEEQPPESGFCLAACGARILPTNKDGRCGRCIADKAPRASICQECGEHRADHDDSEHAWRGFGQKEPAAPVVAGLEDDEDDEEPVIDVPVTRKPESPPALELPPAPVLPKPPRKTICDCGRKLGLQNKSGRCTPCQVGLSPKKTALVELPLPEEVAKVVEPEPAEEKKPAEPPDVGDLSDEYLLLCLQELMRRHKEDKRRVRVIELAFQRVRELE